MAMAQRAMGLLRRSLGFAPPTAQRALSTSAAPAAEGAAAAAAEAVAKEAKKRKKKNLFDVVQFLPGWGVGYKVAKTTWRDVSYQITKINLYKDGRHGKAWGIRYKAGQSLPLSRTLALFLRCICTMLENVVINCLFSFSLAKAHP
ncbi:hypothetical protein SETIT_1G161400v2 [Setaria italica]|uniref:Uncharacterized protein n=1 Tax=Setaria italica TaxID=4555 RepID=A0A368PL94_SETIT|nr:hypothetical protein SETIT_1G161400v2 [Setaria italica]